MVIPFLTALLFIYFRVRHFYILCRIPTKSCVAMLCFYHRFGWFISLIRKSIYGDAYKVFTFFNFHRACPTMHDNRRCYLNNNWISDHMLSLIRRVFVSRAAIKVINMVLFSQSDPSLPVLVAGDPERKCMAMNDKQGGIEYHDNQLLACVSRFSCICFVHLLMQSPSLFRKPWRTSWKLSPCVPCESAK
jgi:hypothetical protein